MKRYLLLAAIPGVAFVACARADDSTDSTPADAGVSEASAAEGGGEGASDATADVDAEAIRCSNDFCIVETPPPSAYGFTKWMFTGVKVDPVIGTWAIANGQPGDEGTAQLLRFEDGVWKPRYAPYLGSGADKRGIRLKALSGDGKGHLIAIGTKQEDELATIILRSDGVTVTTESFPSELYATWMTGTDDAWVAGPYGVIAHSVGGGDWVDESNPAGGLFYSVWGSGPEDVFVGGISEYDPDTFEAWAYVGHRTVDDAGAPSWAFEELSDLQRDVGGGYPIDVGIRPPGGQPFISARNAYARLEADAGANAWVRDPFLARKPMRALWAPNATELWAATDTGRLAHCDGTSWREFGFFFNGAPVGGDLTGISGTPEGEIFVVGAGVALRRQAP